MAERIRNVPLAIYTSEFLITGFVKIKPKKILFSKFFPRRISEIINAASERMQSVGEKDFLEIANADVQDLRSKEIIRSQAKRIVVSKSAIKIIVPIDVTPIEEER